MKAIKLNILRLTDAEVAMLVETLAAEIGASATRKFMQRAYELAKLSEKILNQASLGRERS